MWCSHFQVVETIAIYTNKTLVFQLFMALWNTRFITISKS